MKMFAKGLPRLCAAMTARFAALAVCAALAFGMGACSSGGDDTAALLALASAGTQTGTSSDSGTQSGGTNPTTTTPEATPTPTVTYVITFNANDGSENPSTVTQNFTAGIAQALIPVEELGFSKAGFSFAGWGRAPKSKQASYADGASYTATANETLYALWSEIPIYSVNIPVNANGSVTANPATATAGTEITLSNAPNEGYQFTSYSVTDADGTAVAVTDGKFTMPAKNVTVTAVFTALTYTITFNANDGSPNPTTATQTFTAGTPQNLKTIAELGFAKEGFNFAGWLTAADATDATYADGASYTGTAAATLWANWSAVPVYSVNIQTNEHGTVTASPAAATAGTEITLSNMPAIGYKFVSYSVTDADGAVVIVNDGKFTMPAKNVTVTATFSAINYNVNVGTFANGRVTASLTTATVGTSITLTASPSFGYELAALIVTDSDGASVAVSGTGNSRIFAMPAKNVTVTATFGVINYSVTVGTIANGSVTASPITATAGTEITLSNTPNAGYQFASYSVTDVDGGSVAVANGKFTMPAKNVTVTATFDAINYSINMVSFANGSVTAMTSTATVGTSVTLTATPASDYGLSELSVTDEDGTSVSLNGTGNSRTFTMPAKSVTVTAAFSALPTSAYTKIGTATLWGTEYDLVTFGLWPQTIKDERITVNENETLVHGDFTYCKGSDGQWYVKQYESALQIEGCKYSDGTDVKPSSANSYKWFKVEPIKWRVLTTNYNGTGKKFLFAENILIAKRYDARKNNYQNSEMRKWLNSNVNSAAASDYGDSGGFLKTAFTAAEIAAIASVSVDNSARSTNPDANANQLNNGANPYASDTPTDDKIFLLSEQEVTKRDYAFSEQRDWWDACRVKQTTDFAKASGVYHENHLGAQGGWWWLRSPDYDLDYDSLSRLVGSDVTYHIANHAVHFMHVGVVPALCVSN